MTEADHNTAEAMIRTVLVGNFFGVLEMPAEGVWDFQFAGAHLNVSVPWRILGEHGIWLGDCDHRQRFGLPEPMDAVRTINREFSGKAVNGIELAAKTADLRVRFEGDYCLEIFNHSSGYEGWNLYAEKSGQVIALGGGDIAIFRR